MTIRTLGVLWVIVLAAAATAFAADPSDWSEVTRLAPGQKLVVVERGMRSHRGALVSATGDTLTLREDGQNVSLSRTGVERVSSNGTSHRLRNLLIGAGIGVACGAVIDNTLGTRLRNESGGDGVRAASYLGAIGVGAGLGALTGGGSGSHVVYRAPRSSR